MSHPTTVTLRATEPGTSTTHGQGGGSGYLSVAFGDPAELVYEAMTRLKDAQFDTFIGRGLSGALVAPLLARAMNKHFAIVRKPHDGSHSYAKVEGRLGMKWLFVDDLMCSGMTMKYTAAVVWAEKPDMELVGAYFYGASAAKERRNIYYHNQEYLKEFHSWVYDSTCLESALE